VPVFATSGKYFLRAVHAITARVGDLNSNVGSVGGVNMLVAPLCGLMRFEVGSAERRVYAPLRSSVGVEDFVSR